MVESSLAMMWGNILKSNEIISNVLSIKTAFKKTDCFYPFFLFSTNPGDLKRKIDKVTLPKCHVRNGSCCDYFDPGGSSQARSHRPKSKFDPPEDMEIESSEDSELLTSLQNLSLCERGDDNDDSCEMS